MRLVKLLSVALYKRSVSIATSQISFADAATTSTSDRSSTSLPPCSLKEWWRHGWTTATLKEWLRHGWTTATAFCVELPFETWNASRSHRIHLLRLCVKQRGHQAPPNGEGHFTGCPWNNGSTTKLPSSPTKHVQPGCHPTCRRSPRTMNQADQCARLIDFYCANRVLNSYALEELLALISNGVELFILQL